MQQLPIGSSQSNQLQQPARYDERGGQREMSELSNLKEPIEQNRNKTFFIKKASLNWFVKSSIFVFLQLSKLAG